MGIAKFDIPITQQRRARVQPTIGGSALGYAAHLARAGANEELKARCRV
ncbi:MAG: hypothetical protein HC902_11375 [Calothrix sp. SM1_5_4]|nr:hypothetical protein [Calothrix sp. SM1_5_4]